MFSLFFFPLSCRGVRREAALTCAKLVVPFDALESDGRMIATLGAYTTGVVSDVLSRLLTVAISDQGSQDSLSLSFPLHIAHSLYS